MSREFNLLSCKNFLRARNAGLNMVEALPERDRGAAFVLLSESCNKIKKSSSVYAIV